MATPTPPDPYPWLPIEAVRDQLAGIPGDVRNLDAIERARLAAAAFCERNKAELVTWVPGETEDDPPVRVFVPGPDVVMAGTLAAARLYARRGSPAGLAAYGEWATGVLRSDPDIDRMLGLGRYAKPAIGGARKNRTWWQR